MQDRFSTKAAAQKKETFAKKDAAEAQTALDTLNQTIATKTEELKTAKQAATQAQTAFEQIKKQAQAQQNQLNNASQSNKQKQGAAGEHSNSNKSSQPKHMDHSPKTADTTSISLGFGLLSLGMSAATLGLIKKRKK